MTSAQHTQGNRCKPKRAQSADDNTGKERPTQQQQQQQQQQQEEEEQEQHEQHNRQGTACSRVKKPQLRNRGGITKALVSM